MTTPAMEARAKANGGCNAVILLTRSVERCEASFERFMSKVDRSGGDDACWPWLGRIKPDGYGFFDMNRTAILAHRVAWAMMCGPVLEGDCILHKCDNPPCVNPAHLFVGTPADNNADRAAKGRSASGESGKRRGEANGQAVLTRRAVMEIRGLARDGMSQRSIAQRHGVSKQLISHVVLGKGWTHVPDQADALLLALEETQ